MGEWRTIYWLPCGCELRQLHDPPSEDHRTVALYSDAPCTEHLCRLCGETPLEGARLCHSCITQVRDQL